MSTTTTTTTTTATPDSYLRFNFPLPEKRYVGLLACQRDPLLTTLETTVVRCDKVLNKPLAVKGGKKSKIIEVEKDEWEIELLDTPLFPEGGGQPSDEGTLSVLGEGGKTAIVREVLRKGLDAVHFSDSPIEVGEQVKVSINVEGRMDKMSQHTGQHLLSGVIDRELQVDTLSWSLTPFPTPCYIELARALTLEEITSVQTICNSFISTSAPVTVEMNLVSSTESMPSSVPSNYISDGAHDTRQGVLRTVEIGGLGDKNPCCGSHFPSLSYLQALYVLPNQSTIRGTNSRLYFLVGPRVFDQLDSSLAVVKSCSTELACSSQELATRVATLNLNARDGMRREKKLKDELAGFLGRAIWEKSVQVVAAEGGIKRGILLREEDATNSLEFISAVSFVVKTKWEEFDALVGGGQESKAIFALASGGSTNLSGGSLLLFGSEELVVKASKEISSLFEGRVKGGGKGRWQGKLVGEGKWRKDDEALLEKVLENACL